jgi:hypothetical protein
MGKIEIHFQTRIGDLIGTRAGDWVIGLTDRPQLASWDVTIDRPGGSMVSSAQSMWQGANGSRRA